MTNIFDEDKKIFHLFRAILHKYSVEDMVLLFST